MSLQPIVSTITRYGRPFVPMLMATLAISYILMCDWQELTIPQVNSYGFGIVAFFQCIVVGVLLDLSNRK